MLSALAVGILAGIRLVAQTPAFTGVVRGVLLEFDFSGTSGEFSVRMQGTHQVYRFTFDAKTYVEREKRRISVTGLQKGDDIEVVSDRDESLAVHYARTIHVIEIKPAPRPPMSLGRSRLRRSPGEPAAPRGNLTYAGVIAKLTPERMVLRTRADGEKIIVLRRDTRYLEAGSLAEAADLKPNTRVYIRAGRNLDDEIEAYQIVWGEILVPDRPR
jgi:hypothetical protein